MKNIIFAFSHICVDRSDKNNHKTRTRAMAFEKGKSLLDVMDCPDCKETIRRGVVSEGVYSEGTN